MLGIIYSGPQNWIQASTLNFIMTHLLTLTFKRIDGDRCIVLFAYTGVGIGAGDSFDGCLCLSSAVLRPDSL